MQPIFVLFFYEAIALFSLLVCELLGIVLDKLFPKIDEAKAMLFGLSLHVLGNDIHLRFQFLLIIDLVVSVHVLVDVLPFGEDVELL